MRVMLRELLTNRDHFKFKSTFFKLTWENILILLDTFYPNFDHNNIVFAFYLYTTTSNSSKKLILLSTKWTLILTKKKNIIDILWTVV